MKYQPRYYQVEGKAAVFGAWDRGIQRPALVQATGTGKTVVFSDIMSELVREHRARPVLFVHRDELVDQAYEKLMETDPHLRVGLIKAQHHETKADAWIASIQSISRRLGTGRRALPADFFTHLVTDECHHAAAESYLRTYRYFGGLPDKASRSNGDRDVKMLGVTATLARADGIPLGHIWQEVVYTYSTVQGINDGFLVMPKAQRVKLDELDLSKVKTMGGDWQQAGLGEAMFRSGDKIAQYMIENDMDPKRPGRVRRGIVFAPTVACAEMWASDFRAVGIRCEVITAEVPMDVRRAAYKATAAGYNDVLISVMVLTEGFDLPSAETCYVGRPTKSETLYTQMVGRVLRPSEETGKTGAFIRDICGVMNDKLRTLIDLGLPKACDCSCRCDFAHLCPKACRCPRSKKGKLKRPCILCAKLWVEQPRAERETCPHYVAAHVVGCQHRCDGLGNPGPHEEDEDEEILDPEVPEPKEIMIDESEIITVDVDLFDLNGVPIQRKAPEPKKKPKAWRLTSNGRPYLPSTTTFDYWIFLHQDPDGTWSVGELSKEKRAKAERIGTGLDFQAAVALAEENHPTNGWLGRPLAGLPSEGQLGTLKNWGVEIPSGCTRQQASELLSDLFASRALD